MSPSISLAMAGCIGSYAEMAMRSPDEIAKIPDDQLVAVYANERGRWGENEKFRHEISKRGLFTPEEWDRIDRKTFRLGDKEAVVWAAGERLTMFPHRGPATGWPAS